MARPDRERRDDPANVVHDIVERTGDVVCRYRFGPTPGYEFVSDSVTTLVGYTPDEFYRDPCLSIRLVHPEDAELMQSVLAAPSGQQVDVRVRWVGRDGRIVATEMRCVVTRDADGQPTRIDSLVRDVTRRDEDQHRLQLLRRRARLHDARASLTRARVLVADDHPLTRAGLRAVLAEDTALELIGEAADGREAVALARALQPDVVLMDLQMPGLDGLEATRQVKQVSPMSSVLILTMFEDAEVLVSAVKAGAAGYVIKGATESGLREAIWEVLDGDLAVDQRLAREVLRSLATAQPPAPTSPPAGLLSAREQEVLERLARGHTNREIAEELIIAPNTVKIHVEHILAKLGVSDRTQAAVRAIELGFVPRESSS